MNAIIDATLAKKFGLNAEEYDRVLAIMGRTPSFTELGIFSVMWSEHCSYKSSRVFLRESRRHFQDGKPQPPQFY
jgi:phosphoribosylformylglycinamidine synthase